MWCWFTFSRLLRFGTTTKETETFMRTLIFTHSNRETANHVQMTPISSTGCRSKCSSIQTDQRGKLVLFKCLLSKHLKFMVINWFFASLSPIETSHWSKVMKERQRWEVFLILRLLQICKPLSVSLEWPNRGKFNANESKWSMWIVINGVKAKLDSFKHKLCTATTFKLETASAIR